MNGAPQPARPGALGGAGARLVALGMQRTLPKRLVLLALLFTALTFVRLPGTPVPAASSAAPLSADTLSQLPRGLFALRGPWLVASWFLLPLVAMRAAGLVERWRATDHRWIAVRPLPEGRALAGLALGTWAAGAAVVLASTVVGAVAAHLASATEPPALHRVAGTLSHPSVLLTRGHERASLPLVLPPETTALALRPRGLPTAGTSGTLEVRLVEEGLVRAAHTLPLAAPGRVIMDVPDSGPLVLEFSTDGNTVCLLPASSIVRLLSPAKLWRGSLALGTKALCAWTLVCSLAVLFGLWLRPWLAGATSLALCIGAELVPAPGSPHASVTALLLDLSHLERGWLPSGASPFSIGVTLALACAALLVVSRSTHVPLANSVERRPS